MELSSLALLALTAATLIGAAVQAATGFGFAILAAPVYLAVLNSAEAVPLLAALHIVQSLMLVPGVWPQVPRTALWRLIAGAAAGCPLGLLLYRGLDVRGLKLVAGIVILAATGLMYVRSRRGVGQVTDVVGPAPGMATGVVSGALTALLVMPGPPLMIMLMHRPMPPEAARALSLTFFAACYVGVTVMNVAVGTLPASSWRMGALLVVPVLAGTVLGLRILPLLPPRHFMAVLYVLLVLAGVGAIASAL